MMTYQVIVLYEEVGEKGCENTKYEIRTICVAGNLGSAKRYLVSRDAHANKPPFATLTYPESDQYSLMQGATSRILES